MRAFDMIYMGLLDQPARWFVFPGTICVWYCVGFTTSAIISYVRYDMLSETRRGVGYRGGECGGGGLGLGYPPVPLHLFVVLLGQRY